MRKTLIQIAPTLLVGLAVLIPTGEARAELTCGELPKFVRRFLQGHVLYNQLDADQFTVRQFGENQPIDTNDTRDGRVRNRRVEIKVITL